MPLVVLESPYAGQIGRNIEYARACVRSCVADRQEAPIASHLLFTQPGIFDDNDPVQRAQGINAARAWLRKADRMVVYQDLGISPGMEAAIRAAEFMGIPIDRRFL
ncbi:hypothetical protein [Bradyrhizobium sp. WSM3983]|uniref:DUF7768 domain-containing protein n=1 Tax=Bradyrhizobium sp. WSM3983 TaxID=1038867 RepID=UPI0012EC2A3A|nr:hypothetical protein [Bradyrhizobium sp. WSM3983]